MKKDTKRVHHESILDVFLKKVHKYAYLETITIVFIYLLIGYFINSEDICMLDGEISYILILLSVLTLFHGFENGMMALGLIAIAMWFFYPVFEYVEFLVALMMTMIFSEFHYYWTKKIKEAEISANYRGTKLDELSKAFYTLKISHDQLEKNYVVKPMSIRNSIEEIINKTSIDDVDISLDDKNIIYYKNFLLLLEKSFNVNNGLVIYKKDTNKSSLLSPQTACVCYGTNSKEHDLEDLFNDYLVDKSLNYKQAIYVSDEKGTPELNSSQSSQYIAAIPSVQEGNIVSLLVIEKMPFMAFNRENLTSVAILLEYFSLEILESNTLSVYDRLPTIDNVKFKYEFARLNHIYKKFNVNSITLVLRLKSELQAVRINEQVIKMLRSLDMVTMIKENDIYYIVLLFPLHDKAAAIGYLSRLTGLLEEKDKKINYMTFNMSQIELLNKYLREDYD